MKTLPDQARLQQLLTYFPDTGLLVWNTRIESDFTKPGYCTAWNKKYAGKPAFTAVDKKGYNVGAIEDIYLRAHRVIYKYMTGQDPDQIDHIDGQRNNNAWVNLRNVAGADNQKNMRKPLTNTSGNVGVRWNTEKLKWQAYINHARKRHNLGYFDDEEDAKKARADAEIRFGFHPNHGR